MTITCSTLQMCVLLIINEQQTTSVTAAGAPTHAAVESLRCSAEPNSAACSDPNGSVCYRSRSHGRAGDQLRVKPEDLKRHIQALCRR